MKIFIIIVWWDENASKLGKNKNYAMKRNYAYLICIITQQKFF